MKMRFIKCRNEAAFTPSKKCNIQNYPELLSRYKISDIWNIVGNEIIFVKKVDEGSGDKFAAICSKVGEPGIAKKPVDVFQQGSLNFYLKF